MTRYHIPMLVCLGLCLAVSAPVRAQSGQGTVRAAVPDIAVDGFSPDRGEPGTRVTIRGRGFSAKTQILFGGRPVRALQVRPDGLTFAVPGSYDDGRIVLRHPAMARDIEVGTFTVLVPATIARFAPQSGAPGTRIELLGQGFRDGDRVVMNGKDVEIVRVTPQRIVAVIPADAFTDHLTVVATDGASARTQTPFRVQTPAPVVTGMSPAGGPPGTTVRLSGQNLAGIERALYGTRAAMVVARGRDHVEITVPAEARTAEVLVVETSGGQARTAERFALEKPPVITRVAPLSGRVGTTVQVFGQGFRAGDRVTLGTAELELVQLRPEQITARIPAGAQSGALAVVRGPVAVPSQRFTVDYPPMISEVTPAGGLPGTTVTIKGQYFGRDAIVLYGTSKLRIVKRHGDHTLVVQVPANATPQALGVKTRTGEVTWPQPFAIYQRPAVIDVQPRRAHAGTRLTVRGTGLEHVDEVRLGDTPLSVVSRSAEELQVDIPAGAQSGVISVHGLGLHVRTKPRVEVLAAAVITKVSPASGRPGTAVVIEGQGFVDETEILLGETVMDVERHEAGRVVARVPESVRAGEHALIARSGAVETRASATFQVLPAAVITGFSPESVQRGERVLIRGRHFDEATKVFWGDISLPVISRDPKGEVLEVRVPVNVVGALYLSVDDGGSRSQSATKLEVVWRRPVRRPGGKGSR